VSPEQLTASKD